MPRYVTYTIESSDGPQAKLGMVENLLYNIQFELSVHFSRRADERRQSNWQKEFEALMRQAEASSAAAREEVDDYLESIKEYAHHTIVLQYCQASAQKLGSLIATVTELDGSTRDVEYTSYKNTDKFPESRPDFGAVVWEGLKSQLSNVGRRGQPVPQEELDRRREEVRRWEGDRPSIPEPSWESSYSYPSYR